LINNILNYILTVTNKKVECTITMVRISLHESRFVPPR